MSDARARARGSRVTGTERSELAAALGRRYAAGESVRAIAQDTGRSFGFVHGLVKEAGVPLRARGGPTRGVAALAATTAAAAPAPPADGTPMATELRDQKRGGKKVKDGKAKAKPKDGKAKDGKAKAKDGKAKGKKDQDRKGSGKGGR